MAHASNTSVGETLPGSGSGVEDNAAYLRDAYADQNIALIGHTTYDFRWLKLSGLKVAGPLYDTRQMAWLLDENQDLSLAACVLRYCNKVMDKRLVKTDSQIWFTTDDGVKLTLVQAWEQVPEQVMYYCQRDAEDTLLLFNVLRDELKARHWYDYWLEYEVPYTSVLVDMECAGLPINLDDAATLQLELEELCAHKEQAVYDWLGYETNLNSPPQLSTLVYSKVFEQRATLPITKEERTALKAGDFSSLPEGFSPGKVGLRYVHGTYTRKGLGLKKPKRTKTKTATDAKTLKRLFFEHEWVQLLLDYRKHEKALAYVSAYPKFVDQGLMYGRFDRCGTVTGRISSKTPNLMNVPTRGPLGKSIRQLFQGDLIVGDHSQLEMRVQAHYSQDPELLRIYREDRDIYCETGTALFGHQVQKGDVERDVAKIYVLGSSYLAGAATVAAELTIAGHPTTTSEAQDGLDEFYSWLRVLDDWRRDVIYFARDHGYVKTIGGRIRRIPAGGRGRFGFEREDRQAVNSVVQGSAGDILQDNMLGCRTLEEYITLLVQVHDELVWRHYWTNQGEVASGNQFGVLGELARICENPRFTLTVPLKFEPQFCNNWSEKGEGALVLEDVA